MFQALVADSVNAPIIKELLNVHACKDTLEVLQTVDRSVCSALTVRRSWPASSRSARIRAMGSAAPTLSAKWLITEPSALAHLSLQAILLLVATSKQVEPLVPK